MKKLVVLLVVVLCAMSVMAQSEKSEKPSGVVTLTELKATVKVEAIDVAKRLITVKTLEGESETFEVDPAVKNLAQVKAGDEIVLAYHESLLWEVGEAGKLNPSVSVTGEVATAKEGDKPGVGVGRQITATVTITGIDKEAKTVTLKGPAGNERTINVLDPKNLEKVKVGDTLDVTYTEALVLAVEKAPAKK